MDTDTLASLVIAAARSTDTNTIATLVIAAATSVTGYFAWRAWRQAQADRQPVVELRHHWLEDGSLNLWVTVRNRSYESIVVERARALRPRRALLTQKRTQGETGQETGFVRATAVEIALDRNVAPVGTPPTMLGGRMRVGGTAADETILMNVQFRSGWRGGRLKIALRIASVSLNLQRRWVTIKRRIPAPTASQSA